jgi:hypothetical protein
MFVRSIFRNEVVYETVCVFARSGKYGNETGTLECSECGAGTYANLPGTTRSDLEAQHVAVTT